METADESDPRRSPGSLEPIDRCPVCDARATSTVLGRAPIGLVRCDRCELVRATATARTEFLDDEHYGLCAAHQAGADAGYLGRRKRHVIAGFDRRSDGWILGGPPGRRVLDIGCGVGALLGELKAVGWDTHGIERSAGAAQMAAQTHTIFDVDIEDEASELEQRFELITMTHVLEHLRHPVRALQFAARHLTSPGVFVVEVPNWEDWARPLWGSWYRPLELGDHISMFTAATLGEAFARAGMDARIDAIPEGATSIMPSVLTAADLARAKLRRSSSEPSAFEGTSQAAGRARTPPWVRTALMATLDALDHPLRWATRDDTHWGANLVAIART